ncbi:MAG: O-antigen ligase family protein, partial [Actinomycetota bacterium]|nr:O-antigen ligase family protein [Actinomycetota bacterium]
MTGSLTARSLVAVPAAALAGILLGALVVVQPIVSVGVAAVVLAAALAFTAPVANLVLLVFLSAIVPYELQNELSVGGGPGSPGLLPSDLLLLCGLASSMFLLSDRVLDRRRLLVTGIVALVLVVALLQFLHGLNMGAYPSDAGFEFRSLLGLGAFFLALPLLSDAVTRRRLLKSLLGLAILLGLWGIVQWIGHFDFSPHADFGVREGVAGATEGRGQLTGGMYWYPIAIITCYAALLSGAITSFATRVALTTAVLLNAISLFLTYERTIWLGSAVALALVTLRAKGAHRLRALLAAPIVVLLLAVVVATVAPREWTAARERLLAARQYETDNSLLQRIEEVRRVSVEIEERPLAGSGLGATMFFSAPEVYIEPHARLYVHNTYLWLAWKIGIPATLLLVLL